MKLVPIGDSLVPLVEKLKPYFVQKSGDTMTGVLNAPYFASNTALANVNGPAPANDQWEPIVWGKDAAGNVVGYIENFHGVSGSAGANYCAKRTINGTTYYNFLSLQIRPNGRRFLDVGSDDVNMQGSMSVVTHGGSWISQVSAAAPIIVSPAIPTNGNRYDAIMRGTFADGSRWTVGGIEKSLDIAYFTANRTENGNDGRIRFTPDTGRILAWGSSPRVAAGSEVGGSNQTGGSIGAGVYTDGEGGNIWWTAPDGSYNEIDSYNNTRSRIYTHTSDGTWGGVYWTRTKSYDLDYMHGWTWLNYVYGSAWTSYNKGSYSEFLVCIRHGANYNASAVIKSDHIDGTTREFYMGGGYGGEGYLGRDAAVKINNSQFQLSYVAIDAGTSKQGETECWIYGR